MRHPTLGLWADCTTILDSVFPGVIAKLWKKGKLFLFGGESISASSLTSRLVGGKPLSHASVMGKIHAREILNLLMDEKAHDALLLARMTEKSCEAVSCEALMEIYKAQEANDVEPTQWFFLMFI